MNYFAPCPRELLRKLRRALLRARLWRARRQLAAAETELGLLGWQQADFDADTERQVREIEQVEREQTRLTNEAAAHGIEMRRLEEARAIAAREYQEARRLLQAAEQKAREPAAETERRLAEKRKIEPNFEQRIPDLDRELKEITRLYTDMLQVEPQTPKIRQELVRLRERVVAIPNEKSDLRTQHLRTVTEIRALEEAHRQQQQQVELARAQLQKLDSEWEVRAAALQAGAREAERQKARYEKEIRELESAKANPYQRIGQVLARSGLAPMNQPEALEKVRQCGFHTESLEAFLAASHEETAQENFAMFRNSCLLWGGVLVLLAVIGLAASL